MKAAVQYGPNDVRIEEIPKPECPKGGALIKVMACGLCGSDIRNLTTDSKPGGYPQIWGHEHAGIIEELGEGVTGYEVGQRVIVFATPNCGRCKNCRAGKTQFCLNKLEYVERQGGFAQYMPFPAEAVARGGLIPLPDDVPFEAYGVIEPTLSVIGCQDKLDVNFRDTVVILGAGPVGRLHADIAKIRGAKKVIMTEISSDRLEGVEDFGVDVKIDNSKCDPVQAVLDETDGVGADKVISANPSTVSQQQALLMAKPGGYISFFGGVPKGAMTEIDSNIIHYKGLWISGQTGGTALAIDTGIDLVLSGRIDYRKYITKRMPLDKIMEAIDICKAGKAVKIAICPWMDEEE